MTVSTVTSEALQLKLRQLLPSQQGFGTDLSASDTIIPVIDLTASAEGSDVRQDLQTALSFGSQTEFTAQNGGAVVANTAGFYRVFAQVVATGTGALAFTMSDGVTTKVIWQMTSLGAGSENISSFVDFVVFLDNGEDISVFSSSANSIVIGSSRQIADKNGTLVQPVGFTPQ